MKPRPIVPLSEYRKLSDEEVVYRYAHRGDQQAMHCLYERYAHLVYGVCMGYFRNTEDSREATQQIFIKLVDDLVRFKIDHFKGWLFQVARNHCLMQLRKSQTVSYAGDDLPDNGVENADELHHLLEKESMLNDLEEAVMGLAPEQRTCIEAFYLHRKTYSVIAEETGYTPMQVKSYIQNGRRNLKIILTQKRSVQS